MNKKKIVSSFLGLAIVGLIGIVWLNSQPVEDPIEQKIAPKNCIGDFSERFWRWFKDASCRKWYY